MCCEDACMRLCKVLSTVLSGKFSVSEHCYFHELNLRNNGIFVFLEDILLV